MTMLRTKHSLPIKSEIWSEPLNNKCIYKRCYTLDVGLVGDAWDLLSQNTWALELADYPRYFHGGLLKQLERKHHKHGR